MFVSEDQFQTLKQMIESMRNSMEARFEQVDGRFEQVDQRFEKVTARLSDIDKDLMRIDAVLATKPNTSTIFTTVFGMTVGTIGMLAGATVIANVLGVFN